MHHQVLQYNPRALSSALASLGTLQPRALGFLNCLVTYLGLSVQLTVRLIKKFTFRTVVNMHICVVHLTYLTLLLPRMYVLAGVRVVRAYRLKFLLSLAN